MVAGPIKYLVPVPDASSPILEYLVLFRPTHQADWGPAEKFQTLEFAVAMASFMLSLSATGYMVRIDLQTKAGRIKGRALKL